MPGGEQPEDSQKVELRTAAWRLCKPQEDDELEGRGTGGRSGIELENKGYLTVRKAVERIASSGSRRPWGTPPSGFAVIPATRRSMGRFGPRFLGFILSP